ncbi:efflux transporter outer membrane subunit [Chelatococcus sambhunathii]|uniref:Efflux transporter outer membrane subunit n=1 Tax=Chelatococcus sambhunathii TaxID=363953 RepID=A0ABU1DIB4_9HYPH|nr:efflux transporter outer membrane subunit [Chelatococcus sambhunathii]
MAAAAICGLSLSGCADKWDRPALGVDTPGRWKDVAAPKAAWPAPDWWRGFGSAELTSLILEAERANQDIGAAKARIEQADAQVRINGATLIPVVDGTAQATGAPNARTDKLQGSYQLGLNASYELDFWGKNRASVRSAQASAVAARFDEEVVALSVQTNIANTYFALLSSQERLAIARGNVKSAQTILDAIQARVEVGTASALDRAQQRAILDQQRAALPPIEQEIRTNETAIALLVGRPPIRVDIKGGRLTSLKVPKISPGLPSALLVRRPDVRQAEATLAASDADITAARAEFLPSIDLTAQGGFESTALRSLISSSAFAYQIAGGLTQPILDQSLPGNLDLAKGQYRENLFAYRKAAVQSFVDVENALIGVRKTAEQVRLQEAAVKSAREAYDIAQAQLKEGAVDIVTVLNTQQTLFDAQDSLVAARLARFQALVSMFEALGGGWAAGGRPAGGDPLPAFNVPKIAAR